MHDKFGLSELCSMPAVLATTGEPTSVEGIITTVVSAAVAYLLRWAFARWGKGRSSGDSAST